MLKIQYTTLQFILYSVKQDWHISIVYIKKEQIGIEILANNQVCCC